MVPACDQYMVVIAGIIIFNNNSSYEVLIIISNYNIFTGDPNDE